MPNVACRAAVYENMALRTEKNIDERALAYLGTVTLDRKVFGHTLTEGRTAIHKGALLARWVWGADKRAEIHDGLVVDGRLVDVEHLVGKGTEELVACGCIDGGVDAEKA